MIQGAIGGLMGGNQTSQGAGALAPLTAVEQGGAIGTKGLEFPSDLGTQGFYIKFDAVARQKGRRTKRVTETPLISLFLPLPPTLNDAFQSNYTQEGVGLFGELGRELGDKWADMDLSKISADDVMGTLEGMFKYQGLKLASSPTAAAGVIAGVLGMGAPGAAVAASVSSAARGALVGEGIAINPFLTQIFTGVNLKSHAFTFKLMPKSLPEAETLKQMITMFKKNMLPSLSPDSPLAKMTGFSTGDEAIGVDEEHYEISSAQKRMLFSYPNEWRIKFSPNVQKNLYPIKPCVLTNVAVQYHGENKAFYFKDVQGSGAHPVSVNLSLSFMETEIYTQEDVKGGSAKEATTAIKEAKQTEQTAAQLAAVGNFDL